MLDTAVSSYRLLMNVFLIEEPDALRHRLLEDLAAIEGIDIGFCALDEDGPLWKIRVMKPDVAIIDLQLPGGALPLIRAIKSTPHPPIVIALSSCSSIHYRAASHHAGADFFFDKIRELDRLYEALAVLKIELEAPDESWPTGA